MSSGQQFNLRWNNHTNNILQVFMEQFTSENLVDVTLSCQGQFLKAHKMILSACSPYFQELFRQHQVQHPVIIMNGMKFVDIKLVVEFMYRGEIKVLETELDGLLATAETLQVKGLSNVRNKYEKGDIQGSEQPSQVSRGDPQDTLDHSTSSSSLSSTPMHLRRKRQKRSNSPVGDGADSGGRDGDPLSIAPASSTPCANSDKNLQPFVQVTMNDYTDDDLPATIKVEPPDIRDIDEEPSGWESPKLVIDLPESSDQVKPNIVPPKPSPRINKSAPKVSSPDFGKPRFVMDFPPPAPGTSQGNGELAHQLIDNQREHKQVSQWLRKRTGKIPRPPNAFMIFANEWRRKLAFQHPTESNKEISVRLGIMWKNLSSDTKESYYTASRQADEEHKRKYPGYYYSPKEARLRKTLKHDLAMARKAPKAMEAMHLVKVLMTDGNDNAPYVLLQDSPQVGQQADQQVTMGRKKSARVSKDTTGNEIQLEKNVQKDVDMLRQTNEALSSSGPLPSEDVKCEVDLTDDK